MDRKNIQKYYKKEGGFTLIEMLVSIGIFVMVTTIAVYNHGRFNSSVLLTNLAYEIALSVRQAQFYGITVKAPSSSTLFDSGFGVHFVSNATNYILFEDKTSVNNFYDSGEMLETFNIKKGNKIGKICLTLTSGGTVDCSLTSVDISFIRPNPDSVIKSPEDPFNAYYKAEVCVQSAQATFRKIIVDVPGQISVAVDSTGLCD
jgi:prepilin-type N-terminal cleavage/methylation domain-containing protein